MKPKIVHQEAMDFSFKAKQALMEGNYGASFELYKKSAELESQVADFYIDKPELEPTRSIIIRSAAFMNLKAGLIEESKKYIFIGLLNTTDESIKEQLNNALEIAVSFGNLSPEKASNEYNYLTLLRQRSVNYILEPTNPTYGHSVTLEMVRHFADGYLKSLKAFAVSKFKRVLKSGNDVADALEKEWEQFANPLITGSSYGSFRFSVANDFLQRKGEDSEIIEVKSTIVSKYHDEILVNQLSDRDIDAIKKDYTEEEVNEIFRPLSRIKAVNSAYKIGYYDVDSFTKIYAPKIINRQKTKLITAEPLNQDQIGTLESLLVHKRSSDKGKVSHKTISKQEFKSYESTIKINTVYPANNDPIILSEEILISMNFDSGNGFTFTFDDLNVEYTDIEYEKAYKGFHTTFYAKLIAIINESTKGESEKRDWQVVNKLINNPEALKR